jgi:hypothetical protein
MVSGTQLGEAEHYRVKADSFVTQLKGTMFTETGTVGSGAGNGHHYMRGNFNENPNDADQVRINNSVSVTPTPASSSLCATACDGPTILRS